MFVCFTAFRLSTLFCTKFRGSGVKDIFAVKDEELLLALYVVRVYNRMSLHFLKLNC
jgi:hypothetical protein